jgi:hypothetical protein
MNFSDFICEAKALSLSPAELKTVTDITNAYINHYQATSIDSLKKDSVLLPRTIFSSIYLDEKDKSLKPRYIHLGTYIVSERKTKNTKNVDVFLVIDAPSTKNNGVYRESAEEIYLFHDLLVNFTKQRVTDTVSHEIIHAVQHYKYVSDRYNKPEEDKDVANRNYYLEPIEKEATLGGIVSSLYDTFLSYLNTIKKYNKLYDKTLVRFYTRKASQFIDEITTFIQTSPGAYKQLTLSDVPEIILSNITFFTILSDDRQMRKKYQTDLFKVAERMKKDLKFVKSGLK